MLQLQTQKPSRSLAAAARHGRRPPVRTLVRVLAVAGVVSFIATPGLPPAFAQGLPSGMNVVHGQASAVVKGSQMTVTNSANAVLNWQAFSVGAGNQVRFDQPAATSRVLNRVVGNDASKIFGSISSNGQVWLVNPHGVLFGRDARVDVGSLVASTLNLPLADWINGRGALSLSSMGGAGAEPIVNQGELRAASGGRIWLLGGVGGVRNEGLIAAPDGQVVLAAGHSVDLVDETLPNVAVRVSAPGAEVLNLGRVTAGGGRVDLLSAVVNQSGIVQADSIGAAGGVVRLAATESLQLAAASVTSADGADGGRVLLDAGAQGTLLAAGSVQAVGGAGRGGEVQMLGRHVGLAGDAAVDASGAGGGGQVFVGGGLQGKDSSLRNAEAVYFGPAASVRADATDRGDGGRIILWSDQATRAYGSLSARGGAAGGDGGFIETSGGWLDARPASVRTDAPAGRVGEWLLDPYDIYIVANDPNPYGGELGLPNYTSSSASSQLWVGDIAAALAGSNVTITTGASGGTESGDIVMSGADLAIGVLPAPRSLTLNAAQDISLTSSSIFSTASQPLTVNLNAGRDISLQFSSIYATDTPLAVNFDAVRDILLRDSEIYSDRGQLALTFTSGRHISMVGIDSSVQIYGSNGPLVSTFDAQGNIDIDDAYLWSTGSASVGLDAGGNINISNLSLIYALNGSLLMDAVAGLDIDIGLSTWIYARGPMTFTASAGGDFSLLDNSRIFTSAAGTMTVRIDAGADFIVNNSDIYADSSPVAAGTADLSLTVNAGRDIRIENFSSIQSYNGPVSVALNAFADIVIDTATIGYSDPPFPLSLSADAGNYLYLRGASIQGEGSPSSVDLAASSGIAFDSFSYVNLVGDLGLTARAPEITFGTSIYLDADGPVQLFTDRFVNAGFTSIRSYATGTSLVLAGLSAPDPYINTFANNGNLVLNEADPYGGPVPPGRWLVYLREDTQLTGLCCYDFLQYGMRYASEPAATGNGPVYAQRPVFRLSNQNPITKEYDGNTDVTTADPGLQVTGLLPGHVIDGGLGTYVLSYAAPGPDAGTGIRIAVSGFDPAVSYGGSLPVYGYAVASDMRGDITPRTLTVSGLAAADKVYDGTPDAALASGELGNLVPGQSLQLTLIDGTFDTPNVGIGKLVTGTLGLADGTNGLASNYQLPGAGGFIATAAITPRPLTLGNVLAADKVYDGTRAATLSVGSLGNLVAGETLGLTLSDSLFDTADAGRDKPVTATAALTDGTGSASNYRLAGGGAISTTADITPRPLTVAGVLAADKVYDGTRAAELSGGTLGNLVSGQTLGLTLSDGQFDTANAGVDKPVTGIATLSDGSGQASNYTIPGSAVSATASISPRPLVLSAVVAADKVYDGTRAATFPDFSLANLVAGETLGLTVSNGLFDTAIAGTAKSVTGTAALVDGTGRASNYQLIAGAAISTTADINPRPLTIVGAVAADKVYDGTRDAVVSGGSLVNLVPGETLGLTLSGGLFDTANAGVDKPVVVGTATLSDGTGSASNYVLANGGAPIATATIDPRPLTLSGVLAADKVYDGTRTVFLTGGDLANLVAGETLGLALEGGLFDTPNVGANKSVSGTVALVDGTGLAANYTLGEATVSNLAASILPRLLTVSGALAADKVYDGTRDAVLSGGSLLNLVPGETLALNYGPGLFDTADAGTGKPVVGTAAVADGTGLASNYQLAGAGAVTTQASISPRSLTLSGVIAADKVYDGTRSAALSGGELTNLVAGESLALVLSGQFDTASVGVGKPVDGSAALADASGRASNYVLASPTVSTTADVTPAVLQYVADPQSVLLGLPLPPLTGRVTGFVPGETLDTATSGTLGFATEASSLSLPGSYAIDGFGLAAPNYTFAQATGNAQAMTIVAPPPTEAANEVARITDELRTDPMLVIPVAYNPGTMRTLDALQGWRIDNQGAAGAFGSIYLDAYSRSDLAALLAARSSYKGSVFAVGMKRLESDPTLADLPPCASMDEVDVGKCLVTDELVAQAEREEAAAMGVGAQPGVAPPPLPVPPPALPPAPSPPPAAAVAPPSPPEAPPPVAPPPPPPVAAAPAAPTAPLVVRPKTVALTTAPPMPSLRPVRAAALPQIQRKIAVLVGLDNYVDERIPLLENAGRDVEAVARVLETQLGYQTVVVRDASREAIVGALNRLALTARAHDSVVVYYAGHGTVVDATGLGYWIPASADAERPESWISNSDIGKLVGRLRASQVALISDSCFSGSLVSDRRVTAAGTISDPSVLLQRRAAVVMSSGGNEPVADGARNGHSPFAASLMQSLGQLESWRVGNTVFEQVRADVTRRLPQTPHYGAARQGRHAEGADYVFEQRQLAQ